MNNFHGSKLQVPQTVCHTNRVEGFPLARVFFQTGATAEGQTKTHLAEQPEFHIA